MRNDGFGGVKQYTLNRKIYYHFTCIFSKQERLRSHHADLWQQGRFVNQFSNLHLLLYFYFYCPFYCYFTLFQQCYGIRVSDKRKCDVYSPLIDLKDGCVALVSTLIKKKTPTKKGKCKKLLNINLTQHLGISSLHAIRHMKKKCR